MRYILFLCVFKISLFVGIQSASVLGQDAVRVFEPTMTLSFDELLLVPGSSPVGSAVAVGDGSIVVAVMQRAGRETPKVLGATFVFDATTGALEFPLVPSAPAEVGAEIRQFGSDVAIYGDTVAVGARKSWFPGLDPPGAGGVFVYDVNTGEQLRLLSPAIQDPASTMGLSVDINDRYVAAGDNLGIAYVYDLQTGQELHRFPRPEGSFHAYSMVSVFGDLLAVGYPRLSDLQGGLRLFDLTTGEMQLELMKPPMAVGEQFGTSVVLQDGRIFVNTSDELFVFDHSGSLLFERPASYGNLSIDGRYLAVGGPDAQLYDIETMDLIGRFPGPGGAIAIRGDLVVRGNRADNTALVYHIPEPSAQVLIWLGALLGLPLARQRRQRVDNRLSCPDEENE